MNTVYYFLFRIVIYSELLGRGNEITRFSVQIEGTLHVVHNLLESCGPSYSRGKVAQVLISTRVWQPS